MILSGLTAFLFLSGTVAAVPRSNGSCRPACKRDECLGSLDSIDASSICASFLEKTVTLCPTVVPSTETVTITEPETTTLATTQLDVPTETIVSTITSTTTIFDVATVQVSSQVLVPTTVVVPATVTITTQAVFKRETEACSAATASATELPPLASACSGVAKFSSACSCLGFTEAKTVTVQQSDSASTIAETVTEVPVVTVTNVETVTSIFTEIQTTIIPATVETTTSTESIMSLYTDATVVSITSTTTVAVPACTQTVLMVNDQYGILDSNMLKVTTSPDSAQRFRLSSGALAPVGSSQTLKVLFGSGSPPVSIKAVPGLPDPGYQPLTCTMSSSVLPSALTCTSVQGSVFQICSGYVKIGPTVSDSCSAASLSLVNYCGATA